jgi:hypothetical protein
MKTPLIFILGTALFGAACGTSASDSDTNLDSNRAVTVTVPPAAQPAPAAREVVVPEGTLLQLRLTTAVASDTTHVEDAVSAELAEPITVGGRIAMPAGSMVSGVVNAVDGAGRVKGRARIVLGFTSMNVGAARYDMRSEPIAQVAAATKGEDATKIGVGAGVGAAVGGILGGKKGAAEGAAVGGGAGTGLVLATKGSEVRLEKGTIMSTRLTAPMTVRAAR